MRVVNAVVIAITALAVIGGYLQEKARLGRIQGLPVTEARGLYEAAQKRRERVMVIVTAVLSAAAVAALIVRARA